MISSIFGKLKKMIEVIGGGGAERDVMKVFVTL